MCAPSEAACAAEGAEASESSGVRTLPRTVIVSTVVAWSRERFSAVKNRIHRFLIHVHSTPKLDGLKFAFARRRMLRAAASSLARRARASGLPPTRHLAAGYVDSVMELIGTTPMVRLRRVVADVDPSTKVLVKLEMQNPGGSVKDRIALSMIEEAEKRG